MNKLDRVLIVIEVVAGNAAAAMAGIGGYIGYHGGHYWPVLFANAAALAVYVGLGVRRRRVTEREVKAIKAETAALKAENAVIDITVASWTDTRMQALAKLLVWRSAFLRARTFGTQPAERNAFGTATEDLFEAANKLFDAYSTRPYFPVTESVITAEAAKRDGKGLTAQWSFMKRWWKQLRVKGEWAAFWGTWGRLVGLLVVACTITYAIICALPGGR